MPNNQLFSIDKNYSTKCTPTARFRDNVVTLTVFRCFWAVWIIQVEKEEIDGIWYTNINIDVEQNYTFTRQANGILEIRYGRLTAYHSFDIPKNTMMTYNKLCTLDRYMEEVEEKSEMIISVHIDKYTRLEIRRFGNFEKPSFLTDGMVVTEFQVFHVSKSLLSLYSPFFLNRFKQSPVIDLTHIPTNIVQMILDLLYPPYSMPKEWEDFEIDFERDRNLRNQSEDGDGEDGEDGIDDDFDMDGQEEMDDQDMDADNDDLLSDEEQGEDDPNIHDDMNNFLRHPPDHSDNRNEQDNALKTAAQELQLDHIVKIIEYKMKEDVRHERDMEQYDDWEIRWASSYNEDQDIHRLPFSFAYQSVRNSGFPVKFENRIEEVVMFDENNIIWVDFMDTNGKWEFSVFDFDYIPGYEEVIRRSLRYTEDEWKKEKEALKEKYMYMKLGVPRWQSSLVVDGTMSIEFKCEPPIKFDLKMKFKGNDYRHQYIGLVPKEVVESKCEVNITMNIRHINAFYMRIYLDYQQYHPDICNATVTVGTDVFHVCKEILCYNSPVLLKLFEQSPNIKLDDISSKDFRRVLNLIYPTQLVPYSWRRKHEKDEGISESIERLLAFADKYDMELIKDNVSKFINTWYGQDVAWLASLIEKYNMPKIQILGIWNTASYLKAFKHPDFRSWSVRTRIGLFDQFMDKTMNDKKWEEERNNEDNDNWDDELVDMPDDGNDNDINE